MYGQCRYPLCSPRRTEREGNLWGYDKVSVGDVVKRSSRAASRPGVLAVEEVGTVVRVDGPGHIAPFKVRTARGVEGWYAADELIKIAAGRPSDPDPVRCSFQVLPGEQVGLLCKEAGPGIVYVKGTVPGSPAARAGIPTGMVLRSIAHIPINSAGDVKYAVDMFRSQGSMMLELLLSQAPSRSTPSPSPSPRRGNTERYYSLPGFATSPIHRPSPSQGRESGYGSSPSPSKQPSVASGSRPASVAGSVGRPASAAGSVPPSVAGSIAPPASVAGSKPASVAGSVPGSKPASVAGSVAASIPPSVAGSKPPSATGTASRPASKPPSVAGSVGKPPSVAGSAASKPASVAGSATSKKSKPSESISKIQQVCLDIHNQKRSSHGAPPLAFDAKLAANALKQAEVCQASNTLSHGNCDGEGQNAFFSGFTGTAPTEEELVKQAVSDWYDEISLYKKAGGGVPALGSAGHFTQVVWKGTTHVGIAVLVSEGSAFVIANYSPPGNIAIENDVRANVNA
eukprot:TRINITY_DN19997_c0_g1_i1.p1 TRINITY_DN19997_c0_g1~~TRINITY_DN19997_c0_g1_i1.p1  ORF type:complete len:526 (+),score=102.91 TRINITY_DN19997_c0_g1_i1:42-1580(+)